MGIFLFNSFRMATGMHSGTEILLVCLMKYIKNYIFCIEITLKISNTLYK
jgi:hypothetical protein